MSDAKLKLEGVVNIAKADALHHEMEEILTKNSATVIDASELQRIDTAVLQLLASFMKSMSAANLSVSWGGVTDELIAAAKLLGLEQVLSLVPAES